MDRVSDFTDIKEFERDHKKDPKFSRKVQILKQAFAKKYGAGEFYKDNAAWKNAHAKPKKTGTPSKSKVSMTTKTPTKLPVPHAPPKKMIPPPSFGGPPKPATTAPSVPGPPVPAAPVGPPAPTPAQQQLAATWATTAAVQQLIAQSAPVVPQPLGPTYPSNILRGEAPKRKLWRGLQKSYDYSQRQPFIARRKAAIARQMSHWRQLLGWSQTHTQRVSERGQLLR